MYPTAPLRRMAHCDDQGQMPGKRVGGATREANLALRTCLALNQLKRISI